MNTATDGGAGTVTIREATKRTKTAVIAELITFTYEVMQTVSFMMFIEEEAIQIRGFGIMSLIREDKVQEAKTQINALEGQCNNLETFVDSWGWVAPYIRTTYSNYVSATRDEIDAWRTWVASKEKVKPKYGVRIKSAPTNANIKIDGTDTHKLTPHAFYDLAPGSYHFKLTYYSRRRGYISAWEMIDISKAEVKEYKLELKSY